MQTQQTPVAGQSNSHGVPTGNDANLCTPMLFNSFEPGCDIDGCPEQIAVPFQNIAEVNAYSCPKLCTKAFVPCHILQSQGTINSFYGACEFCEDAISGRVGDPTLMLFNQLLGCATHRPKGDKCPRLIRLHQA